MPRPSGGSTAGRSRCVRSCSPTSDVTVIEPGAVGTELTDHITHAATKEATEQFVKDLAIRPEDIADVIAFAVSRPAG
jgi:NADP-dependent 3-hydroxy acid dehydrogenase YdfG